MKRMCIIDCQNKRGTPQIVFFPTTGFFCMHFFFPSILVWKSKFDTIWTAPSEFGTYRLCEQRWFRRACASAQSRQNLHCSLIQAVSQEEPSDRKPDPWPLWMAGHAQLKLVMMECSKTQIRLTGLILKHLKKIRPLWHLGPVVQN